MQCRSSALPVTVSVWCRKGLRASSLSSYHPKLMRVKPFENYWNPYALYTLLPAVLSSLSLLGMSIYNWKWPLNWRRLSVIEPTFQLLPFQLSRFSNSSWARLPNSFSSCPKQLINFSIKPSISVDQVYFPFVGFSLLKRIVGSSWFSKSTT